MTDFRGCQAKGDDDPSPCPRCGATVSGNDQVRGVCQAPEINAAWKRVQISDIVREVAELPDRTSPDDQPEMMLVTAAELTAILAGHLSR